MKKMSFLISLAILSLALTVQASTIDNDQGSEVGSINSPAPLPDRDDCYTFGGAEQGYDGSDRGRGNTYTFSMEKTLTTFSMELDITGEAELYFYVLMSPTLDGAYSVAAEEIVTTTGSGLAFYQSPYLGVALLPDYYYGIGVAWANYNVGYVRNTASLPRTWELGTVEDAMQITGTPPYSNLSYNHFTGAEYSMELCFEEPVANDQGTWGHIKALYK